MPRLSTLVAALLLAGAPALLHAQTTVTGEKLSPADSALVERLSAQYKSAAEAKNRCEPSFFWTSRT